MREAAIVIFLRNGKPLRKRDVEVVEVGDPDPSQFDLCSCSMKRVVAIRSWIQKRFPRSMIEALAFRVGDVRRTVGWRVK